MVKGRGNRASREARHCHVSERGGGHERSSGGEGPCVTKKSKEKNERGVEVVGAAGDTNSAEH